MYNLPINRPNSSWDILNKQFLKGGFDWYNQPNPSNNNWYYLYYIREGETYSCKKISRQYNRRRLVTHWLRNIEMFENVQTKYKLIKSPKI